MLPITTCEKNVRLECGGNPPQPIRLYRYRDGIIVVGDKRGKQGLMGTAGGAENRVRGNKGQQGIR